MTIRVLIDVKCDAHGCQDITTGSAEVSGGSCGVSAHLDRIKFNRAGWADYGRRALCPKHAKAERAKAKREADAELDELVGKIELPPAWVRNAKARKRQ